ncbi:MAG: FtsX-like permease family protein [Clostridiales bacterium]|nr:FtsX-like permease family protein [Clostridiales bacterium]
MKLSKISKLIKKYIILFIILFVISFVMLITSSNILGIYKSNSKNNDIFSKSVIEIMVSMDSKDISMDKFLDFFKDKNKAVLIADIKQMLNDEFMIVGMYKGEDSDVKFPLVKGSEFSEENYKNKDKAIILKESVYHTLEEGDLIEIENNKEFIKYLGEKYEIKGIIDSENGEGLKDAYVNIYSFLDSTVLDGSISQYTYTYDNGQVTREDIRELQSLSTKTIFTINELSKGEQVLNVSIKLNISFIISTILLIVVCLLTTINISVYWFSREKKEFGIRKLIGGNNISLIKMLFIRYVVISSIAVFTGFIFYEIIKKLRLFEKFMIINTSIFIDFISIIILMITLLIFVIIALIKPIISICKLEINSVIKGEE